MKRREKRAIYDATSLRKMPPEIFEIAPEPSGMIGGLGEEILNTFPANKKPTLTNEVIVTGNGKPQRTAFRADLELEQGE